MMGLCLKTGTVLRILSQSLPLNQLLTSILLLTVISAYCSDMGENVHRLGLVKSLISFEITLLSQCNTEQFKLEVKSNINIQNLCICSSAEGSAADLANVLIAGPELLLCYSRY